MSPIDQACLDAGNDQDRPAKRQRGWIARQACEACRAKKTRCDEELPCSLCRNLGLECQYAERKPTKNEVSLSTVIDLLAEMGINMSRLEVKVEGVSTQLSSTGSTSILPHTLDVPSFANNSPYRVDDGEFRPISSPRGTRQTVSTPTNSSALSFSAHKKIQWPGIRSLIPTDLVHQYPDSYPSQLELTRPPLTETPRPGPGSIQDDWLSTLSLSCVKELSNAYFDTFNRIYPLLDRDHFFLSTLGHVVREGFTNDPETCVVLNVMALGAMGLQAYRDCGFGGHNVSKHHLPTVVSELDSSEFALALFTESLTRSGSCLVSHDIQSCQYYMTAAVFFLQIMRPADMWLMLNRGATLLTALLQYHLDDDAWSADVRSRVFWSGILLEVVVVQEFEYSPSRLKEWEDTTPLPKFVPYPPDRRSRAREAAPDDSHYQYHFLAQVAHRIILSRIRDELFNSNPSVTVATELRHQLEEWRANLPMPINPSADFERKDSFSCPADVMAAALLRTRYRVGIYHLGRPFCYKAIHQPDAMTEPELGICAEALQMANQWPTVSKLPMAMSTFMPLKLFIAGQMLGQLLILYAFQNSPSARVRTAVPVHHQETSDMILSYMSTLKRESPTVAMDYELVSALYGREAAR